MRITRLSVFVCSLALSVSSLALMSPASDAAPSHPADAHSNAAVTDDLRNLAVAEETYLTDKSHYGTFAELAHDHAGPGALGRGIQLVIVHIDGSDGYCLRGEQASDGYREFYDSQAGGVRHSPCPKTTKGPNGGTRNGAPTAQAKSFVKDLAAGEETYLVDHHTYGSAMQLVKSGNAPKLRSHVRLQVRWYDHSHAFCLKGTQRTSSFWFDSRHGGSSHGCAARPKAAKSGGSY